MSKKFEIKDGDISDGHHTFDELYEHRNLLFINLCLLQKTGSAAWRHDDTTKGWFILYLETANGQISYHIENHFLPLVRDKIEECSEYKFDGHNANDVLMRLVEEARLMGCP